MIENDLIKRDLFVYSSCFSILNKFFLNMRKDQKFHHQNPETPTKEVEDKKSELPIQNKLSVNRIKKCMKNKI